MELLNLLRTLTEDNSTLLMLLGTGMTAYGVMRLGCIPSEKDYYERFKRKTSAYYKWCFDTQEEDALYFGNKKESSPLRDFYRRTSFNPEWKGYISEWEWDN